MIIKKVGNKIHTFFEFNIKQVGLYTGLFFSFVVLPIVYGLDVTILHNFNFIGAGYYDKLVVINNNFASVLLSILLTTFSVVFVVMQLASSQFSPRILRHFMANDLNIQQFIGLYLGAISSIFFLQIFCPIFPEIQFQACLLVSVVLSLYAILVSFPKVIIHLNDNMNVATITNKIKSEVIDEIEHLYAQKWQDGDFLLYENPKMQSEGNQVLSIGWSGKSGYLSEVDYSKLNKLISEFRKKNINIPRIKIYQKPIIGEFIMQDATVLLLIEFNETITQDIQNQIEQEFTKISKTVFQIHTYRSYKQDIAFGVRKLVDIAIKAISPAVNDPTTCLNCIDYMGEIVRQLAIRRTPSTQSYALQKENIYVNEFGFNELVNFAFDQIFQWGKKDPVVVKRLVQTIYHILPSVFNPYNLMVLIKELEAMELSKIYVSKNSSSEHTQEQILMIEKELNIFRTKAQQQIQIIKEKGIFANYEQKSDEITENITRKIEIETLNFLTHYAQ